MQVFKFGGASIKDAEGVKNVVAVVQTMGASEKLVVVSAMGKTTNAMENIVHAYFDDKNNLHTLIDLTVTYHKEIMEDLFDKGHEVFEKINKLFTELNGFLAWNKSPKFDFVYDQIVCYGELIATTIISAYFNEQGLVNTWLDARRLIKTDSSYRDGKVNWELTQAAIKTHVHSKGISITQGFIASDSNNFTTTLGREGSDYTGGIFSYCLNAENLTIWKDVPGVLNGDPRVFNNTVLLHKIPYEEAIELAFYGASVIHPKTLQPLQRKEIPLYVKSFMNPTATGTMVSNVTSLVPKVPCYIVKKNQVLISLSSLDFSFMVEDNIAEVFQLLSTYKLKVDLIQNSAISFSVCVDNKFNGLEKFVKVLKGKFKVDVTIGVSLYTIRHFTQGALNKFQEDKTVLLKQVAQNTVQLVTQN